MKTLLIIATLLIVYGLLPMLFLFEFLSDFVENHINSDSGIGGFIDFITVHYPLFGFVVIDFIIYIVISSIEIHSGKDFKYLHLED